MSGNCQASAIVYKATVKANDGEEKTYTGCTDRTFKERHYGHRADERDRELRKNTKLATYIWEKKDSGVGIEEVKWEILKQCVKYAPGGDKCNEFISRREGTLYSRSANTFATFCVTGSRPLSPCLYSLCTVKDAKADARRPSSTKALTSHNSLCMPNCTSRHH